MATYPCFSVHCCFRRKTCRSPFLHLAESSAESRASRLKFKAELRHVAGLGGLAVFSNLGDSMSLCFYDSVISRFYDLVIV